MKPVAYSVSEVLKTVGISRTTFYALAKSGKIKVRKIGTRSFVLAKDLDAWLESLPVLHELGAEE
ncbi:helix-turn-helix domain-containing protein [Devosia sp. XJ19-1]|uniref:Helix-turn-helix domain-containing protein n=1 Tax=Devosia ureilytica TaxID=2952754 RepID=A0A9Q4AN14_9HYPH|nr:helix-turn-helix domain-containing protein [Devosia ureilytica]MCP8883041.1 helix-turn-helix domain-containing protein [Devosia ureilytica]MCP8886591.1 helix-turn-helix domain-containing protein [Devosia ureilytica]